MQGQCRIGAVASRIGFLGRLLREQNNKEPQAIRTVFWGRIAP